MDLEGGILTIHFLSLQQQLATKRSKQTQKRGSSYVIFSSLLSSLWVIAIQNVKQHVLPSSHIAKLSTALVILHRRAQVAIEPALLTPPLPLIILVLRGLKRSGEGWSGGKGAAVRSACQCRSSLLAAAAVEASAAVTGSEERGRGKGELVASEVGGVR